MKTYILSYDLSQPGRNYASLYEAIKSYPSWAHLAESTWAVRTSGTAAQIRDHLRGAMDGNDQIVVVAAGAEGAWFGLPFAVSDWLKKNLTG